MQTETRELLRHFSPKRVIWPVLIGLSVAAWLFFRDFDSSVYKSFTFHKDASLWIALAIISVFIRDFAYMVRIRALTDNHLNWYRSFIVIMLWEFSSALAPGIIGGGFFFAMFILSREGINMGKSITAIMNSSFLDGVFLAVMAPVVYWVAGKETLFSGIKLNSLVGSGFFYSFWVVYMSIVIYKLFVAYALFVNPYLIRNFLRSFFSLKFLKRWRRSAFETGEQLVVASKGLKHKDWKYWSLSLIATFASWTARFSIVNCIIHAFDTTSCINDFVIYGKQVIMGIIIIVSPTPGGSGIAELMFNGFLGEFITKGLAPTLGLFWRMLSYYPYLLIGTMILPKWIRHHVNLDKLRKLSSIRTKNNALNLSKKHELDN